MRWPNMGWANMGWFMQSVGSLEKIAPQSIGSSNAYVKYYLIIKNGHFTKI